MKYAGDILADVNKVYVINIADQGVQSLTFPAFCGTSGFVTTFTNPLLDKSCSVSLTFISKSTTCPGVYF